MEMLTGTEREWACEREEERADWARGRERVGGWSRLIWALGKGGEVVLGGLLRRVVQARARQATAFSGRGPSNVSDGENKAPQRVKKWICAAS